MDTKEEVEPSNEDRPSSPMWVLQQLSEGAFRVAGEALHNMYSGGGSNMPQVGTSAAHRRSQSELVTKGFQRSHSFQRIKAQVHKAWGWGGRSKEEGLPANFNPEVMANQKRQWYQLHPKSMVFNFRIPLCMHCFCFENLICLIELQIVMEFSLYLIMYN